MPQTRLNTTRILRWYWISVIVAATIACGVAAFVIFSDYASRRNDETQKAMMFAQALAEQTTEIVASLDALSHAVVQDVNEKIVDDTLMSEVLRRRARGETKAIIGIAIVARNGHVAASGLSTVPVGLDLSSSAEFKALSQPKAAAVFFNHPGNAEIETPKSCIGQTMTYSRIIYDENHQFDGFILVLVNEHYLYKFFKRFEEQPDMVLGLVDRDGIIRASNYGFAIGRNVKNYIEKELRIGQGVQIRGSEIVDHRLIIAYYKSSAAPLWAYAGFPVAPLKKAWMLTTVIVLSALLALFTLLVACGVLLKKYLSSQIELLKRDIERIREKQELEIFQGIASASDLFMVFTDAEGRIIVANTNFLDTFDSLLVEGQFPIERMLGLKPEVLRSVHAWQGTHNLRLSDTQRVEVSWVVSTIQPANSADVRNFVILGLDITERRAVELALYQSEKLLTLGQMATGIAHELSQPLATLAMMLDNIAHELVVKGSGSATLHAQVAEMILQVDRATNIARHMRVYGRKSDGFLSLIDPAASVENALVIWKEQIESETIEILMNIDHEVPLVLANQILLEQILLNFIVNARDSILNKATMSGPFKGVIRIALQQTKQDCVSFCVKDNGTGFEPDVEDQLFDPFFTTKPPGQGMGLGLALCHRMAKDMNGTIHARSVEGGAEFVLILPTKFARKPGEIIHDK